MRWLGGGVVTREDLAEQAVDDLTDITDIEPELAGQLIMAARAVWFEEESAEPSTAGAAAGEES